MVDRDYRQSHITLGAAHQYDGALYGPGTYDSWLWELEKTYLARAMHTRFVSRRASIRHLDFACGTGRILAFLEPLTHESTGVDVSGAMLGLAKERVRTAKLLCADITKADVLPAGAYDLVTAFRFFLNADDTLRRGALTAIRRVLVDDGILIANVHGNLWSLGLVGYVFRRYVLRQRVNAMSLSQMKRLLVRHGFEVLEVGGLGWATRQIYRILGREWCDRVERMLRRVTVSEHLATNLILVCRKDARDRL